MKIEELENLLEESLDDFGDEIEALREGLCITAGEEEVAQRTLCLMRDFKDNIIEYLKSPK